MKNLFFVSFLAIAIASCSPKTAGNAVKGGNMNDLITSTFMKVINASNSGDWKTALDMTYPKVFNLAPRAQMEQMYSQMEMMGIKTVMENIKLSNISDFVTNGSEQFAKAKMTGLQKIKMDASMVDMMMQNLKAQGGDMADKMRKTDDGIEMDVDQDLYIIKDASNNLTFLQADDNVKPMLSQILPSAVIEKLAK